jgi:hypothetical protein
MSVVESEGKPNRCVRLAVCEDFAGAGNYLIKPDVRQICAVGGATPILRAKCA